MHPDSPEPIHRTTTLVLAGDLMLGRGLDQVMAEHADPRLHEPWVDDAREYVRLAEARHGPVPAPVTPAWPWGEALAAMAHPRVALRLANLETALTLRGRHWPGKAIHYRAHPAQAAVLQAARLDVAVLANNHVLDWGAEGLEDTLAALRGAGVQVAGAGADDRQAAAVAAVPLGGIARLFLTARATADSGVPDDWAAGQGKAGVALLPALDEAQARALAAAMPPRSPGRIAVISLHWGANQVRRVPEAHRAFARRLIDLGAADIVHGHSSHHPLPVEVYRGRLILYGCGDLLNDYEGLSGRGPLHTTGGCLFAVTVRASDGSLCELEVVPWQRRRLRLQAADASTLAEVAAGLGLGDDPLAPAAPWRWVPARAAWVRRADEG